MNTQKSKTETIKIPMIEEEKKGRGGKRPGAGRPTFNEDGSKRTAYGNPRKEKKFRLRADIVEELSKMKNATSFVEEAVDEKLENYNFLAREAPKEIKEMVEKLKGAKLLRVSKNEINLKANHPDFNSKLIYEECIYFCSLFPADVENAKMLKNKIMEMVDFDGKKFAVQRSMGRDEFAFIVLCNQKRISRDVKVE